MITRALTLFLAAGALLGRLGPLQDDGRRSPTLDSARARWERFTPEQKERAREHYERFLALSEEERQQLVDSARRLKQRVERVQSELAPEVRRRLEELEPEKRRTLVREIVADDAREAGARIRGRLPEPWVERLEQARPEERTRFLREFQVQQRDRVARYAIGELGKRLGLPAEEISRLQHLRGEERGMAVLDLRKRLSERQVDESGLPPGISREQWDGWLALTPEEFFEVFQRYRHERMLRAEELERAPKPAEKIEARKALLQAAEARPDEVLALSDLPAPERAARLRKAKRERCMQTIREGDLLSEDEIRDLAAKGDHEFFEVVRRLLRPPRH